MPHARFARLAEIGRPVVAIEIDGAPVEALAGDTVLVAALTHGGVLRQSEFGDGARAGFCLMGACQDCWMWTAEGERLRACTTPVATGMRLITQPPSEASWPRPA
ncbi:(2Fe-2S)-binding protein [Terrarubrum flagellatum]|uniref:(2Fe-2S)-binding protein n=1 Tax=Terrirubrum flagellatum TaxID=2895980 RepID=UPI003144EDB2